ncbi:MAG: PepSY domain-containing protein [Noviherbaspirillum sp.]
MINALNSGKLTRLRRLALSMALAACGLIAFPVWSDGKHDHERAREAVQSGQILPLYTVLERLGKSQPGQVLEVELERENGQWIYEIKLLRQDGQLVKLELDARTAEVLRIKPRTRDGGRSGTGR